MRTSFMWRPVCALLPLPGCAAGCRGLAAGVRAAADACLPADAWRDWRSHTRALRPATRPLRTRHGQARAAGCTQAPAGAPWEAALGVRMRQSSGDWARVRAKRPLRTRRAGTVPALLPDDAGRASDRRLSWCWPLRTRVGCAARRALPGPDPCASRLRFAEPWRERPPLLLRLGLSSVGMDVLTSLLRPSRVRCGFAGCATWLPGRACAWLASAACQETARGATGCSFEADPGWLAGAALTPVLCQVCAAEGPAGRGCCGAAGNGGLPAGASCGPRILCHLRSLGCWSCVRDCCAGCGSCWRSHCRLRFWPWGAQASVGRSG